jgi:hypothetical protein
MRGAFGATASGDLGCSVSSTFWWLLGRAVTTGCARLFETLAAHDQNHVLASRTLELQDRVQNAGEQLAAIAAQIADGDLSEVNLLQWGVHGR